MNKRKQFDDEIHHRAVKKFKRQQVILNGIDEIWGIDLADLNSLISYNNGFQAWAKEKNITMYSTHGESKSVVVERWVRSLKDIATKYFTEHATRDWVNNLDKFLKIYNNREHSSIKMTLIQASKPENYNKV